MTDAEERRRDAALRAVFSQHYRALVRLATHLGADADAEDVVSEAFYELHRRWVRVHTQAAALSYLRSVITNLVRMRVRHLGVVRRHAASVRENATPSAESAVVLREDQRAVMAALATLSARQREVLVRRYWLDMTVAEVAGTMGISAGAVKSHAARAKAALARALQPRVRRDSARELAAQ